MTADANEIPQLAALRSVAARAPGLSLLVLFGSRARGDVRDGSDWDLGYLGTIDEGSLHSDLSRALGTDAIDLVDLARAGALLRYRAARDGRAIVEATPDAFEDFCIRAATFWCDVEPVLREAYSGVLAGLDR